MATELTIRQYKDPAPLYKATDDVYLQLALRAKRYYVYEKGQIIKIVHHPRPSNQGNDWWEVVVVCSIAPSDLVDGYSPVLAHISREPDLAAIQTLQEEIEKTREKFSNIEEGYKRAIKAMMEKK